MGDVMRQVGRRRIKRLLVLGSVCGGLVIAMMRLTSQARAAEATSLQTDDCSWYEIPPPECGVDEADAASGFGNDGYYDPDTFPWPATFNFWGIYNGHTLVGTATRQGTSSAYNASFDAVDGSDCFGAMEIDLSWGESAMIEMGISTTLGSWYVTASWFCE